MDGCIFEGQIPVRVKHNDLDERQAQLTLRITQEVRKPGSRCDFLLSLAMAAGLAADHTAPRCR